MKKDPKGGLLLGEDVVNSTNGLRKYIGELKTLQTTYSTGSSIVSKFSKVMEESSNPDINGMQKAIESIKEYGV